MYSSLTPALLFVSSFFGCATPEPEPTSSADRASKELLDSFNTLPDSCMVSTQGTAKRLECDGLPDSYFLARCDANTASVGYAGGSNEHKDAPYAHENFGLTASPGVESFGNAPYVAKLFARQELCGKNPVETTATNSGKPITYAPLNSRWR